MVVREGQLITIDGVTGQVMLGEVPTVPPQLSGASGSKSPKKPFNFEQPPHRSNCSRTLQVLEPRQKKKALWGVAVQGYSVRLIPGTFWAQGVEARFGVRHCRGTLGARGGEHILRAESSRSCTLSMT